MKVVINTTVTKGIGETHQSFKARQLKDVNNNYTLGANEAFSTDLEDIIILRKTKPSDVDYKRYRSGLQQYGNANDTDWGNYSDDWKQKICNEKATDLARIKAFFNDDILVNEAMKRFDRKSTKNRKNRFSLAKASLLNNVDDVTGFLISKDIATYSLEENYVNHGMEGSESLDPVLGIYDFLNSTSLPGNDLLGNPWSAFSAIGLATRPMTFRTDSNYNQSSLVGLLNEYLKHGKKVV